MKSIVLTDPEAEHTVVPFLAQALRGQRTGKQLIFRNHLGIAFVLFPDPTRLPQEALILVDSDAPLPRLPELRGMHPVITYGYSRRASLTFSGLGRRTMQCCIQRNLRAFDGSLLLPQEFSVPRGGADPSRLLAATAVLLYSFGESYFNFRKKEYFSIFPHI